MISLEDRQMMARAVEEAHRDGARLKCACAEAGITVRPLQRWQRCEGFERADRRPQAVHPVPAHALSEAEREQILQIANEPRFAELPPARTVPMLADEGVYVASESSFSRVLRVHGQTRHRGRAKAPQRVRPPSTHVATAPRQVFCWDMTYLPASVMGRWFFLYLVLDLYSRKIVGFEVHETDDSEHAVNLLRRTALTEDLHTLDSKPVLHGDHGATLKAGTVLAMMNWLGLRASYSRPRVSDDNAFVESLIRMAKYRPQFPAKGFVNLDPIRREHGRIRSCSGTTTITATAPSATSARRSDTQARITPSCKLVMRSTSAHGQKTHGVGCDTPETGIRSPSSRSIPSARQ